MRITIIILILANSLSLLDFCNFTSILHFVFKGLTCKTSFHGIFLLFMYLVLHLE